MISALNRYPRGPRRTAAARAWGRRGAAACAALRLAAGPDAETRRRRALDLARGLPLRDFWTVAGLVRVARSRRGRLDQLDVIAFGQLWRTCGPRRLPAWLR
jgi:hypothetical protein